MNATNCWVILYQAFSLKCLFLPESQNIEKQDFFQLQACTLHDLLWRVWTSWEAKEGEKCNITVISVAVIFLSELTAPLLALLPILSPRPHQDYQAPKRITFIQRNMNKPRFILFRVLCYFHSSESLQYTQAMGSLEQHRPLGQKVEFQIEFH